jgi:hypothetical protein
MKIAQGSWKDGTDSDPVGRTPLSIDADLVLAFGSCQSLNHPTHCEGLKARFPAALVIGCSTAGEILGARVRDEALTITAIDFDRTTLRGVQTELAGPEDSYDAGRRLAAELAGDDLVHVLVLSDGLAVNGGALTRGLAEALPAGVTLTGGLSADGDRFQQTFVLMNGTPRQKIVAAVGFYGKNLKVGCGSFGGWEPFGPERVVTRSEKNVLQELDGRSALGLYEKYLGDFAGGLPATALLFPLSIRTDDPTRGVVRTVLGIDRERQTMTFAGDIPQGAYARLMRASTDGLVAGAAIAAEACTAALGHPPQFALLVSCVGRRLVMKQRAEEELEAVRHVLGAHAQLAGFYSYGEIAPFAAGERPELHNQTMTVTGFWEDECTRS